MERSKRHSHKGMHRHGNPQKPEVSSRHGKRDSSVKKKKKLKHHHRAHSASSSPRVCADDDHDGYLSPYINHDHHRSYSPTILKDTSSRRHTSPEPSHGQSISRKLSKTSTDRRRKHKKLHTRSRSSSATLSPHPHDHAQEDSKPSLSVTKRHRGSRASKISTESSPAVSSNALSIAPPLASSAGGYSPSQEQSEASWDITLTHPLQLSTTTLSTSTERVVDSVDASAVSPSSTWPVSDLTEDTPLSKKRKFSVGSSSPVSSALAVSQRGISRYRHKSDIRRHDVEAMDHLAEVSSPEKESLPLATASTPSHSNESAYLSALSDPKDVLRLDTFVDKLEKQRRDRLENIKVLASTKSPTSETVASLDKAAYPTLVMEASTVNPVSLVASSKIETSKRNVPLTHPLQPVNTETTAPSTEAEKPTPIITSKKDRLSRFHAFAASRLASKSGTTEGEGSALTSSTQTLDASTHVACETDERHTNDLETPSERFPHQKMKLKIASGSFPTSHTTSPFTSTNTLTASPISFFQEVSNESHRSSVCDSSLVVGGISSSGSIEVVPLEAVATDAEQMDPLDAFMLYLQPDLEAAQAVANGTGNASGVAIELPKAITLEEIQGWSLHKHKWSMEDTPPIPLTAISSVQSVSVEQHSSVSSPRSVEEDASTPLDGGQSIDLQQGGKAAEEEDAYYKEFLEQIKRTAISSPPTDTPSTEGVSAALPLPVEGSKKMEGLSSSVGDSPVRTGSALSLPSESSEGVETQSSRGENRDEKRTTPLRGMEEGRSLAPPIDAWTEEAGERLFSDEEAEIEATPKESKTESYFDLVKVRR
ncbi:hypothetical protein IE077_003925, partial [Cardiosporidium cionae]